MTFLNPLVLIGLAAAAIPVLLHLLHLRRVRTVDFSTLRFLEELQKSALRRLRIRQWLLLILRTLIIIALVLAFARPALRGSSVGAIGRARTTLAILIDDSPSMGLRNERGTLFSQAKTSAADIIALAAEGDVVYLLPLSSVQPTLPLPLPHSSAAAALSALQRLELSDASIPIADVLAAATGLLNSTTNPNKELYIITDWQATQWPSAAGRETDSVGGLFSGIRIFTTEIPGPEPDNAAVSGVRLDSKILTEGRPVTIEATVRNFGKRPLQNGVVSAYLEGRRVAQQTVTVSPGSSVRVPLVLLPPRRGFLAGSVEMDADAFPEDNSAPFAFRVPERIAVLIVGRTPSDTRFLSTALTLGGDSLAAGRFSVTVVNPDLLATADLAAVDVLVLAGLPAASGADAERFAGFVRSGRGLLFFPAAGLDTASIRGTLFSRLGLPPSFLSAAVPDQPEARSAFLSFRNVDADHPLLKGLYEERLPGRAPEIESPRVFRTYGTKRPAGGHAVIALSDGTVFLAEYLYGTGRILQFAVDAGGQWSDFPLRGLFAPLLTRAVLYAAMPEQDLPRAVAGEPFSFPVRLPDLDADDVFSLRRPDGRDERLVPTMTGAPGVARFAAGPAPAGVATLMQATGGGEETARPVMMVSIDPPQRESDLRHARAGEEQAFWTSHGVDTLQVRRITWGEPPETEVLTSRFGIELFHALLIFALACALIESAVARDSGTSQEAAG